MKLDNTDIKLLKLIQEDSRMTIKEMASALNLSTTPIFERLKKLEKHGVITQYVALLNPKKIHLKLTVFIHVSIIDHGKKAIDAFVEQIQGYPEVMECHHITGESDYLLKVVVEDIERYNEFVTNKLSTVPNVNHIRSSFSLSSPKYTTAFPIRED